jgi:hypothetical protein
VCRPRRTAPLPPGRAAPASSSCAQLQQRVRYNADAHLHLVQLCAQLLNRTCGWVGEGEEERLSFLNQLPRRLTVSNDAPQHHTATTASNQPPAFQKRIYQ